jgi:hypothetical protein
MVGVKFPAREGSPAVGKWWGSMRGSPTTGLIQEFVPEVVGTGLFTEQQPRRPENKARWHSGKAGRPGSGRRDALGQVQHCSELAWGGGGMEEGLGVGVVSCSKGDYRRCHVLLGWERRKKKGGERGRSSGRCFVEGCGEACQSGWDSTVWWGTVGGPTPRGTGRWATRGDDGMCRRWEMAWSGAGRRRGRGLGWPDMAVRNPQ